MAHYDFSWGKMLTTDWFPVITNIHLRMITRQELRDINAYIGQFFDAHIIDRSFEVSVPFNCPDPWPSILKPIYRACAPDTEEAAKFLGNLYCRYAIARPELWASTPLAKLHWKPRRYVVWLNAAQHIPKIPRAFK